MRIFWSTAITLLLALPTLLQAETIPGAGANARRPCDSSGDGAYNWECLDTFSPGKNLVEIPENPGFTLKLVYTENSPENKFAKYASGGRLYPYGLSGNKFFLHKACLPKIEGAAKRAQERKCQLVVYDGVRPCSAQRFMFDIAKNKMRLPNPSVFVANPAGCSKDPPPENANKVSMHNRGLAVDVSLDCEHQGKSHNPQTTMGGEFDDFENGTAKFALPICASEPSKEPCLTQKQKEQRELLRAIMIGNGPAKGFIPYEEEWWHFNCLPEKPPPDRKTYPPVM